MSLKLLNDSDLAKIPRANLVEFIIEGLGELEKLITLNELNEELALIWATPERKVHLNNLLKLLNILVEESKNDPLTGRILVEAELLLSILHKLKLTLEGKQSENWLLGVQKKRPEEINQMLQNIIAHLEQWKEYFKTKLSLPIGNGHTKDTYHPQCYSTYPFKPDFLPDDHRSNFFFEVKVKELCPFTTTILFHPYAEAQRTFQEEQSLRDLVKVNLNVDLTSFEEIERVDNIRGFRVHGPKDDKNFPGSYIVVRGGHHRTRAIFQKYIRGEAEGNFKILVQLVTPEDFPDKSLMKWVKEEIKKREIVRSKLFTKAE